MINGYLFSLDSQLSKFFDGLMARRWCLPFARNPFPKCNSGIYVGDIISSWYRNLWIPLRLYCLDGSSQLALSLTLLIEGDIILCITLEGSFSALFDFQLNHLMQSSSHTRIPDMWVRYWALNHACLLWKFILSCTFFPRRFIVDSESGKYEKYT